MAVVPGASCRYLDEVGCLNVFLFNIYRAAFISVYAQQSGAGRRPDMDGSSSTSLCLNFWGRFRSLALIETRDPAHTSRTSQLTL